MKTLDYPGKLYTVQRTGVDDSGNYVFRIIQPNGQPTGYVAHTKSPVAPNWLLKQLATFNSRLVLDRIV